MTFQRVLNGTEPLLILSSEWEPYGDEAGENFARAVPEFVRYGTQMTSKHPT